MSRLRRRPAPAVVIARSSRPRTETVKQAKTALRRVRRIEDESELREWEAALRERDKLRASVSRPSDCVGEVKKPCPLYGCYYHLGISDVTENGNIRFTFPDDGRGVRDTTEMPATCALAVAEEGEHTLEVIGAMMNLTRERIRQVESRALLKLRDHWGIEVVRAILAAAAARS